MSEHEVPLEELHEHIHEHAHESKEKWVSAVALSTAFLAAFAAVSALLSSHYESESMKEHSEAFDQYAYYQAKGLKSAVLQSKMDLLTAMGKPLGPNDEKEVKRYKEEQAEIKKEAEHLTKISKSHGDSQEHFALGVTMFQMSIAIGAISVLTKRRGFWYVSLLLGLVGLYFSATGYMQLPKEEEHGAKTEEHSSKKEGEHDSKEAPKEAH